METAPQISAFLRSLRSVRRFSAEAIPDDVLQAVLEVARWTGSSKNTQPWQLIGVRKPGTLAALASCGPFAGHLAGAAAAIVLVMEDSNRRFDEGRLAQNLMLAAWAYRVGTCIGSLYPEANTARARDLLGVPAERGLHTAISLGYPADASAVRVSVSPGALSSMPIGREELSKLVSWERLGQLS